MKNNTRTLACIECKYYLIDINNVGVCTILNDKPIGGVSRPNWCPRSINNLNEVIQPWELEELNKKIWRGDYD
jgi:hypothetical protein